MEFGGTGYYFPDTDSPLLDINPTSLICYANATNLSIGRIGVTNITGNTAGRTITNAASFVIDGAPTQGANETITNLYALWVKGGHSQFDGTLAVATQTPASASASGKTGTIAWDASYVYICTAANTWKRVAIATW